MSREYEFTHQSYRQKAVLIGLKLFVASAIYLFLESLVLSEELTDPDTIGTIGSILISIWIYFVLCQVKVEVQELFIPPMDLNHALEILIVGAIFTTYEMAHQIYFIINHHFP